MSKASHCFFVDHSHVEKFMGLYRTTHRIIHIYSSALVEFLRNSLERHAFTATRLEQLFFHKQRLPFLNLLKYRNGVDINYLFIYGASSLTLMIQIKIKKEGPS